MNGIFTNLNKFEVTEGKQPQANRSKECNFEC